MTLVFHRTQTHAFSLCKVMQSYPYTTALVLFVRQIRILFMHLCRHKTAKFFYYFALTLCVLPSDFQNQSKQAAKGIKHNKIPQVHRKK